jgi:hypothetical protein
VDAVTRTRTLLARQATVDEVVRDLRAEGFSLIESISALVKAAEMTPSHAKEAVVDSPTWADHRDRIHTRRLIEPPEVPDDETLEQLRAACGHEPRILEAWLIGSQMTRADGSSREITGIALVLDPAFSDHYDEEQSRLIATLDAAAPQADVGTWLFRSWRFSADEEKLSLKIYTRAVQSE